MRTPKLFGTTSTTLCLYQHSCQSASVFANIHSDNHDADGDAQSPQTTEPSGKGTSQPNLGQACKTMSEMHLTETI